MNTENYLADPADFDEQRKLLARRRAIAEELMRSPMASPTIQAGDVVMPNFAGAFNRLNDQLQGNREGERIDAADSALQASQHRVTKGFMESKGMGDLAPGLAVPSLRGTIAQQVGQQLDYPEQERTRTANAAAAAAEKEQNRAFLAGEHERDRQNKIDLRQMPTQHITISGGGSGSGGAGGHGTPFAGASTQVGTDRDGNPVYRVSKTGSIYTFGPDGQPVAHEGAILPKQNLDAASRKAVHEASLGVQGVDDALEKLRHPKATGATGPANAIPGAELVRQYTDTPEAVAARAAVSNIGSLKLHDRSGAAVTVSEFPRLAPFIPKVSDNPMTVNTKLQNLKSEYQRMQAEWSGKPAGNKVEAPTVVRTGTRNGVKVQQMSDGSIREVN